MGDPNIVSTAPAPQLGQPVVRPHIADVKIDSRPVVIPGQAPARLETIAELGVIPTAPVAAPAMQRLRTLTLAPEDPLPEEPSE
jgi:hypothetical protein